LRGCLAAIDRDEPAIASRRSMSTRPDAGIVSVHHAKRERGCDGGIHGIATATHGFDTGARRQG